MRSVQLPFKEGKLNKFRVQHITKFNYYKDFLIPSLSVDLRKAKNVNQPKNLNKTISYVNSSKDFVKSLVSESGDMVYYYCFIQHFPIIHLQTNQGKIHYQQYLSLLRNQMLTNSQFINTSILKQQDGLVKTHQIKQKNISFVQHQRVIREKVEFFVTKNNEKLQETQKIKNKKQSQIMTNSKLTQSQEISQCSFYVVHTPHQRQQFSAYWDYFVQKYEIDSNQISYYMICSAKVRKSRNGFLSKFNICSYGQDYIFNSFLKFFINQICCKQRIYKILQSISQAKCKKTNTNQKQLKESQNIYNAKKNNRLVQLPPQKYQSFKSIKKQVLERGLQCTQNQICRFFYAKSFDQKSTLKSIQEYDEKIRYLKENYPSYDKCFQLYNSFDIFRYIGQTRQGNPIILTQLYNIDMRRFNDTGKYADYCVFTLQLELAKYFKGLVDQYLLIIDTKDISLTKIKTGMLIKSILDTLKYGPQRLKRIIVVNANWSTFYIYKLIKPFLSKKTDQKITILGQNVDDIKDALEAQADRSIIPTHFGGTAELKNNIQQIDIPE